MNFKDMLTTNVEMKLLSLLLASILWLFVASEVVDEAEIPLTVSYINTPPGLFVKAAGNSGYLVHVEGPRILLLRQRLKGVSLRLDLSEAGEGEMVFSEMDNSIKLIQGVKMVRLSPLKVELHR